MTNSLNVSVNRSDLHSLEVPETFETGGSFTLEMTNHGEAAHVHLHIDDTLTQVMRIDAGNHYLEAGETRFLTVEVADPEIWTTEPLRGHLKVVTGHGQETRYIEIVLEQSPEDGPVQVDPNLAEPRNRTPNQFNPILRSMPVAVLGGIALILAVGSLFVGGGFNFMLAGLALIAGGSCAIAAYYLLA